MSVTTLVPAHSTLQTQLTELLASLARRARRRGADPDFEDVCQEVAVQALRGFGSFAGAGLEDLREWVRGVARHCAAEHARRQARRQALERELRAKCQLCASEHDREAAADDREALAHAVGELSGRLHAVIELHFAARMTLREVGAVLGCSADAARKAKDRAVRRLRRILNGPERDR